MKSRQKLKIIPRWEPDRRFAIPLQRDVPMARRAPEFFPEFYFQLEEGAWRISAPLQ